jgi:manganese transport protein
VLHRFFSPEGERVLAGSLELFWICIDRQCACVDLGNYGTGISGCVSFGYTMLWLARLTRIIAMLLQYLSGKSDIAAGHSRGIISNHLRKLTYILPYWLASESSAVITDLGEFLAAE